MIGIAKMGSSTKRVSTLALLILTTSIHAQTYIFGNFGLSGYSNKYNLTYTGTTQTNVISQNTKTGDASFGASGGIGHRLNFLPYYISLEAGTQTSPNQFEDNSKVTATTTDGTTALTVLSITEKFSNPIIAQIKLGYAMSKRMNVFIGGGIELAKFELAYEHLDFSRFATTSSTSTTTFTATYDKTQRLPRFVAGAEYAITPQITWFTTLTYLNKSSIAAVADTNLSTDTQELKFSRKQINGRIGVVYFI